MPATHEGNQLLAENEKIFRGDKVSAINWEKICKTFIKQHFGVAEPVHSLFGASTNVSVDFVAKLISLRWL